MNSNELSALWLKTHTEPDADPYAKMNDYIWVYDEYDTGTYDEVMIDFRCPPVMMHSTKGYFDLQPTDGDTSFSAEFGWLADEFTSFDDEGDNGAKLGFPCAVYFVLLTELRAGRLIDQFANPAWEELRITVRWTKDLRLEYQVLASTDDVLYMDTEDWRAWRDEQPWRHLGCVTVTAVRDRHRRS